MISTPSEPCVVEAARAADAHNIAALARDVFEQTFAAITPPDDMATFLRDTYQPELFAADIHDPAQYVGVARHAQAIVGFVQMRHGPAETCVRGPNPVELQRLYLDPAFHGAGVARQLMDAGLGWAKARGFATVWLGVWENNHRAKRFYAKFGFEACGSHTFLVGADAQTDLLMEAPLPA